jgi:hypothetical protein
VFVMDCTTTGNDDPTSTPPTEAEAVFLRGLKVTGYLLGTLLKLIPR